MIDIAAVFDKCDTEYLQFDRVKDKLHPRPDICAFLLLDKLLPNQGSDMVCGAGHDEIFLDIDPQSLAEVATEDDILLLARCGVHYDSGADSLVMFV